MASALWVVGFAIGIAFGVACLSLLIDAVRSFRRAWGFVAAAHASARPPQPEPVTPLPRRTRPPRRRPATARRGERRRLAA
jgi:hypothetical protein